VVANKLPVYFVRVIHQLQNGRIVAEMTKPEFGHLWSDSAQQQIISSSVPKFVLEKAVCRWADDINIFIVC